MAPVPPVGRVRAMDLVAQGALPVRLGSPHATAMILKQDGAFRIRDLVVDPVESEQARTAAFAAGKPWMIEHVVELARPTGAIHLEARSRDQLLEAMRTMEWLPSW